MITPNTDYNAWAYYHSELDLSDTGRRFRADGTVVAGISDSSASSGQKGLYTMGRFLAVVLWLIYFLSPFDLIPDFIPGLGRIDDIILLFLLIYSLLKKSPVDSAGSSYEHQYEDTRDESSRNQQPHDSSSHEVKDPYRILELNRSASLDEIKRAYRAQAARYHPDKVTHLGEEFQVLAKKKFQEIQWAYETLLKERKAN